MSWTTKPADSVPALAECEWHESNTPKPTVDEQLLAAVRQARSGLTDAALIDEALQALLDRHRAAEINPSYTAYDLTPSTSRTREGAPVGADLGHDHLNAPDPDAANHADQVSESERAPSPQPAGDAGDVGAHRGEQVMGIPWFQLVELTRWRRANSSRLAQHEIAT